MAIALHQRSPVAHWPWGLGVGRKLQVAALSETCCPPPPAHVLSGGRGVEALRLATLAGHPTRAQVGARLEERGMLPCLQPRLTATALHDSRVGPSLDALVAANRPRVLGAVVRPALEA